MAFFKIRRPLPHLGHPVCVIYDTMCNFAIEMTKYDIDQAYEYVELIFPFGFIRK